MSISATHLANDTKQGLRDRWEVAEKAGLHSARKTQAAAVDAWERALSAKRNTDAEVRRRAEVAADAQIEAEWALADSFVTEGNKTYLLTGTIDGDGAQTRRQVSADEKRAWIGWRVAKEPAVAKATHALAAATEDAEAHRDAVAVAERRVKAAAGDLAAAMQLLATLSTALEGNTALDEQRGTT